MIWSGDGHGHSVVSQIMIKKTTTSTLAVKHTIKQIQANKLIRLLPFRSLTGTKIQYFKQQDRSEWTITEPYV